MENSAEIVPQAAGTGGCKRASWSGQIAFVLAAAASAIGLGNLWRFPYLAAQYGGGMFLAVYLVLVATLGFTLMVTEIAIGRKTRQSQLTAYSQLHRGWGVTGIAATVVPLLIIPYYCVIGGWVLKYFITYAETVFAGVAPMGVDAAGSKEFFEAFICDGFTPFFYGLAFIFGCSLVVAMGVKNGIEKSNLVLMPVLLLLALAISVYVVFLPGSGEGILYYLLPNLDCLKGADGGFSLAVLGKTILGAMGQMFYSLSLAMGIMVTYGSYMRKSDSIERCVRRIEIFDTLIAFVAGLMIVPVVYMFAVKTGVDPAAVAAHGGDVAAARETAVKAAMNAGPGLMFVTLPKVFAMLGAGGSYLGLAFFVLVVFAAATSAISLYEAFVASVCDLFKIGRKLATLISAVLFGALSAFPALGYGLWSEVKIFSMQLLDFFDFASSCVLMPIVAILTSVFIGWVVKPKAVVEECQAQGRDFKAKAVYSFLVRYVAPAFVLAILLSEICRNFKLFDWEI